MAKVRFRVQKYLVFDVTQSRFMEDIPIYELYVIIQRNKLQENFTFLSWAINSQNSVKSGSHVLKVVL